MKLKVIQGGIVSKSPSAKRSQSDVSQSPLLRVQRGYINKAIEKAILQGHEAAELGDSARAELNLALAKGLELALDLIERAAHDLNSKVAL